MKTFTVSVSRRVFANVQVEAASAEDAAKQARETFAKCSTPTAVGWHWCDHDTSEEAGDFAVDWVE